MMLPEFMEKTTLYEFLGKQFNVPFNYEGYLLCEYGPDWRKPRRYFDSHIPSWTVMIKKAKEFSKDYLPDPIFFFLSEILANRQRKRYRALFKKYRDYSIALNRKDL